MHVVLLVEDNPGDAALVGAWLEEASPAKFAVHHVTHLDEAQRRARSREFEAAILDLGLPDSMGLDTVRRFRSSAPVCPIVVLTGDEDERLVDRVVQSGADEVVQKDSAGPGVLTSALERAIARHREAEAARERLRELVRDDGLDLLHRDGLVVHDDDGRVVFVNPSAHRILGVADGDVLPDPLFRADEGWSGIANVTSADGECRRFELFGRSLADRDGPAPGRLLVVRSLGSGDGRVRREPR
ncbi:MAG TPA: response regulator [Nannocystaceae bacterium]|nr:response regulator [Nannocystaceae bacterium]